MIKSVFAATAALSMSAGAAFAGPYAKVETNAGWAGDDYTGAVTEFQVGYEGSAGEMASWYVEAGPAIVAVDGEESETEFTAEIGGYVGITEELGVYGELAILTADQDFDELNTAGKLGIKYSF